MADLVQIDTDEEMDKYAEAELIASNPPPISLLKNKKLSFNSKTRRNDVLASLSTGGYVKIGEEDISREDQVRQYSRELQGMDMPFDVADFEAAGFTAQEVEAAGVMPVTQEKSERTEPLREGEQLRILREGGDAAIAAPSRMFMRDDWNRGTVDVLSAIGVPAQQANQIADMVMGQVDTSGGTGIFDTGVGIIDFTPVGLAFGIEEIGDQLNRSIQADDKVGIGTGILFLALSAAEAYPLTKAGAKAVKAQIPSIRQAIADLGQGAEERIAQEGTTLFSNPVGPAVDRGLAAAGRLAAPKTDAPFYVQAREGGAQSEVARNSVLEISQTKGNKKPKIEDLVEYFEQNHQQIYGRKLDPNVEEDFEIAVNSAADEILYQLDQAVSGRGWYDSDVKKTFETLAQIPGLERIADDETLRVIWSAFAAPTSIGNKVDLNTRASTAAFLQFLKTGKVPVNPPEKGAVTEGIQGAGWGLKQKSVAAGMRVISHLIETKGPEGFADWWLSPHTLKELTEVRKAAGLGSGPSGLSGGQNSLHLGAMVLGDKTGRYSLNINGYQGTTKDVWFSRSYNRHFGDMRNPDGSIAGGPRNQTERRRMEEFTARLVDKLADQGLSEQDAQAVLWFYEQNLFTDLGVVSRPGSFSEAAEKIANDLRSGVRGSDEVEVGAEQAGEGLTGFRGISAPKRTIRSGRRGGEADVQAFGPYTRGSGEGTEGDGLLSLTPDEQTQRIYGEAGIALPNIQEAPTATAAQYKADMTSAMSGHTYGAQVEIKSAEELASARLFRTENGSGFALKPDGDIVAVFQSGNETGSVGYAMIQAAVQAGGRKLDAFDTFLPGIYETAGFRPVARLPWNDEFAPDNWDKETFKNFNNGEPDVVFFVYDPNYFGGATDVPRFTDYDDAVAAQDAEIARLKETIDGY